MSKNLGKLRVVVLVRGRAGKGMSLVVYIRNHRLARSYDDPLLGDDPIRAIAARRESAGPAHFSRVFQDRYGPPPSRLRRTPR